MANSSPRRYAVLMLPKSVLAPACGPGLSGTADSNTVTSISHGGLACGTTNARRGALITRRAATRMRSRTRLAGSPRDSRTTIAPSAMPRRTIQRTAAVTARMERAETKSRCRTRRRRSRTGPLAPIAAKAPAGGARRRAAR